MNTLYSLSANYQRDVGEESYEVVVVENSSGNMLDPDAVTSLGNNFHYLCRQEHGVSPAPAINEALPHCRGRHLGLMIDGARMLSPRVISYSLQVLSLDNSIVIVPAYYLTEAGRTEAGHTESNPLDILQQEETLLRELKWQEDGYRLFREACFSNGNRHGYLDPIMECTALMFERQRFQDLGGADESFDLQGGGALNLHIYRQVATSPASRLYVLPGEGNFHQFHGGTSTTAGPARDALVQDFKAQLDSHWPGGFKSVSREPLLYGAVTRYALPFLQRAAESGHLRLERFEERGQHPWPDDKEIDDIP